MQISFERTAGGASEKSAAVSVDERTIIAGCVVCGSPVETVLDGLTDTRFGTQGSYRVCQCVICGLEQLFPRPSFAELKGLYEEKYNFGGESQSLYTRLRERFLFSLLYRLWVHIDGDISFHARRGSGRLLDVGCNEGRGLRIYAANGFQVEGLELNEIAAAMARRTGFVVHTCILSEFGPSTPFDVAVLSNVLEHSLNPREMLKDVHRILAHRAQIWVSCPSSRSWLRTLFGRSWINWHAPFHISHFSPETLKRLLADAGFVDIEVRQISPALWAAQSLIAYLFARRGEKNQQLRNPFLTLFLMLLARFVFFPVLWFGNRLGRGDCLVATATNE